MRLKTLGGLALEGTAFQQPLPLLLLAYLALEGPRTRRYLAELFWPAAKDPRDSLGSALRLLKKRITGNPIEASRSHVQTTLSCDARNLSARLDAGELEAALELYQGSFLEGIDLSPGEELEEWMYATREYIAGRVRTALIQLGEKEAARGLVPEAATHAERAYLLPGAPELDPEDFQRLYLLLRLGDSPLASEVRKEADGFGIALAQPPQPLRSEPIPAHATVPPQETTSTPRHNLPTRSTSFVGRDPELLEIRELLNTPECRLLTLHGAGGIGKTRLALQAAHELLQAQVFDDGIFFVTLDVINQPEQIPSSIAEAVGIDLQGQDDPLERVKTYLGDKSILLILDNFEQLIEAVTLATELLQACPNLELLVTSRERLNVEEEWVLTLSGLPLPGEGVIELAEAQAFDAVQLFMQRGKRARLDFSFQHETVVEIVGVCRSLGGSPLAIELAAAWVKVMSIAEIREEIDKNLGFLETHSRNIPKRHRSIQAAFAHSWNLLTTKEQDVLRDLSVFTGGFRKEAAAEVVGATIPILASLVDKSWLRASQAGRYDRHPLAYQFTRDKLASHGKEQSKLGERHARYHFELVEVLHGKLGTKEQRKALAAFDAEIGNVRTAWQRVIDEVDVHAIERHVAALSELYRTYSLEGAEMFAKTVLVLDETNPDHRIALGRVLIARADHLYAVGRDEQATLHAKRALVLLRPLGDDLGVMRGVFRVGDLARRSGNLAHAHTHFSEGLELAEKHQLPRDTAWFLAALARVRIEQGHSPQTERYCRQVLAQLLELGYLDILVLHLSNFGWLYLFHGSDERAAKSLFEEGLGHARTLGVGHPLMMASLLDGLARVASVEGKPEQARSYLREALAISRANHDAYAGLFLTLTLATVATAAGDYEQAHELLLTCLRRLRAYHRGKLLFRNLAALADLYAHLGDAERAVTWSSLIRHHPAAPERDKVTAQRLLKELRGGIPIDSFDSAVARGKRMQLEGAVQEVLGRAQADTEAATRPGRPRPR